MIDPVTKASIKDYLIVQAEGIRLPTDALDDCLRHTADEGWEETAEKGSTQLAALKHEIARLRILINDYEQDFESDWQRTGRGLK